MGRYDSHKHPIQYGLNSWNTKRINDSQESQAKSIPCHVVKVDKDFIYVAFETQNGIFTPPTVRIPQSMSQYGREPTQVGDKGYAVPANYYMGGVTGDSGGKTDFYPRGNLTTLSFQPVSITNSNPRDVNQLTQMGGPNGWIVGSYYTQTQSQGVTQGQGTQTAGPTTTQVTVQRLRPAAFLYQQRKLRNKLSVQPLDIADTSGTSSETQQNQKQTENPDKTQFSFDKNKKTVVQSVDDEHNLILDKQNDHAHLSVTALGKCFLGGDGVKGLYAPVLTKNGPSINTFARIG